ncbi:MAG TPA: glycosyltransferase family 9 protein [Opitutaceae bacterium]|nr:glycosyltransferase family 9 protein [Opitutaceae bacterium]
MIRLLLTIAGGLAAHAPEWLLRGLAAVLGDLVFFGLRRRRRLVLSNLHHAFPDRPPAWHRAIGRESCRRLIETALLSLAQPFLSPPSFRRLLRGAPNLAAVLAVPPGGRPRAAVFATPHLCGWETLTALPLLAAGACVEIGAIFRPLDSPAADAWVKRGRERFGMRLLSRKTGFQEAMQILRRHGGVGVLFDQNAGDHGALTTLFGRVGSTSELPGLLAERFRADVHVMYPRRLAFWRYELTPRLITSGGPAGDVTIQLNRWLEEHLAGDDNACASWLWAHDRWRHQDVPARRLRLESRRDLLAADFRQRGLAAPPRRTRLWVRMPNWLGDVVMTLPLLRALRVSRPDAHVTLLAKPGLAPLLEQLGVADAVRPLPARGRGYLRHFWRLRAEYPDCYLLFTHSLRGDLEAWLTRCPQRFGVSRPGRRRPLLTHCWRAPGRNGERHRHQVREWEEFLRHFGLNLAPDFAPLARGPRLPPAPDEVIGLICGSENEPEKRWPVKHWRELLPALAAARPGARFRLFGTAAEEPVAAAIALGLEGPVENLAGRTDLPALAAALAGCRLLIANDTGGMHLANALGVPVLALFGPTNPLRTGPVFHAPVRILQPPGCPPTGGASLADLPPAAVAAAAAEMLAPRP